MSEPTPAGGNAALDWTRLDSRYVVHDEWLCLRADTYRTPGGDVLAPVYIIEPRTWVNVLALTREQQVVLVRQYRPGIGQAILELPGGTTDSPDESPHQAIQREFLEETGFAGHEFVEVGVLSPNPANHQNLVHSFLARDVVRVSDGHPDDTEYLEVSLMPLDQVIELAKKGGLLQAMHVATLFLALVGLGRIG